MKRSGVELEWTVIDDDEDWQEPRRHSLCPERRWRRIILVASLTLTIFFIAAALLLHRRIAYNRRQLEADIQSLIDLEARAISKSDRELFLALQSPDDAIWFEGQKRIFGYYAQNPDDWPHLQVTSVERVDDYAWVHTRWTMPGSDERFGKVVFYRLADNAWRQAAPDVRYWGSEREWDVGPLHFVYYERDEVYVEPVAAELKGLLTSLCGDLGCPVDLSLTIRLTLPRPFGSSGLVGSGEIVLPSPAAWSQPVDAPPQIPSVESLAGYFAFEAAGGKERWESSLQGAVLVQAVASWAQERLAYGSMGQSYPGQGQELLRLVVRNGRVPSLENLWEGRSAKGFSYPALIQSSSRYVDLRSAQASAVIDYIVETYGQDVIPELLEAVGRYDALETVLGEVLNVDLEAFEWHWLTWLETYYGFGKGWRFAEAVDYWRRTRSDLLFSVRDNVGHRQYRELMRMAVLGDRAQPLVELWNSGYVTPGFTLRSDERMLRAAEPFTGESLNVSFERVEGSAVIAIAQDVSPDARFVLPSGTHFLEDGESTVNVPEFGVGRPDTWRSAHALSVVRYIADAYDNVAVLDLLPAIIRNDTLDGALRDALGVGLDEFETGWQSWLKARYGDD